MKKIFFTALLIIATGIVTESSAQISKSTYSKSGSNDNGNRVAGMHSGTLPCQNVPDCTFEDRFKNNQSTHQQGSYSSRSNSATNGNSNNTGTSNNSSRSGSNTSTRNGNTNRNGRNNTHR